MAAEKKLSAALENELEAIDKDCIRPLQVNAFQCCAQCCQERSVSQPVLQNCLQNCMRPVSEVEERIKQEVDTLQDRLTRCAQQCQDKAIDSLSTNPSIEERERVNRIAQDCLMVCADMHIPLIKKMFGSTHVERVIGGEDKRRLPIMASLSKLTEKGSTRGDPICEELHERVLASGADPMGSSDKLQCVIDLLSKTISSGNIPFADEINALTSELKIVKVVLFHKYDDIEHLKISFIKKTASVTYLEEFLKTHADLKKLTTNERSSLQKLSEKYKEYLDEIVKKICDLKSKKSDKEEDDEKSTVTSDTDEKSTTGPSTDEKSSASDTDDGSAPKDSSSFYKSKRAKPNYTQRRRNKWSQAAVISLIKGVNKHGEGKWKQITKDKYSHAFPTMDNVAIKDKWRNLVKYGHVLFNGREWVIQHK